ncbi:MAG: hypothetical protein WD068_03240 [Candidatus Babeliales bacterium]
MKHVIFSFMVVCGVGTILCGSTALYNYRIYCQTEESNVYVWKESTDSAPAVCPNHPDHVINGESVLVIEERLPNAIKIQEETIATGGHYRAETATLIVPAGINETGFVVKSWPFNISALSVNFTTDSSNEGDIVTIVAYEDTIVGALTASVAPNDTVLYVTTTVVENVNIGFYVKLFDGVQVEDLGRVIAIDETALTLTVETPCTKDFSAASPTYVQMMVKPIDNFELGRPYRYQLGLAAIGGSHLAANKSVKAIYTNKSTSAKKLVIDYEYLY